MARLHARAARSEMFWLLAALTQPGGEDMSLRDAAGGVGNAHDPNMLATRILLLVCADGLLRHSKFLPDIGNNIGERLGLLSLARLHTVERLTNSNMFSRWVLHFDQQACPIVRWGCGCRRSNFPHQCGKLYIINAPLGRQYTLTNAEYWCKQIALAMPPCSLPVLLRPGVSACLLV